MTNYINPDPEQKIIELEDNPEPEQDWIFTFGYGHHPNHNYFVRIFGTFHSARDIMIRNFGLKWSHQYPNEEEAGVREFNLHEYKFHQQ